MPSAPPGVARKQRRAAVGGCTACAKLREGHLQVAVAVRDHQGRPAPPDAELPHEVVRRHALYADAEAVDAVQVVGRTDGDPVVARVVAAARAVDDVVVLQAGARRAGGGPPTPAAARAKWMPEPRAAPPLPPPPAGERARGPPPAAGP